MASMDVDAVAPATLKRTRGESLLDAFAEYRAELDTHYDRRERIIKQSRDITAQSKKLIFSAHRWVLVDSARSHLTELTVPRRARLRFVFLQDHQHRPRCRRQGGREQAQRVEEDV